MLASRCPSRCKIRRPDPGLFKPLPLKTVTLISSPLSPSVHDIMGGEGASLQSTMATTTSKPISSTYVACFCQFSKMQTQERRPPPNREGNTKSSDVPTR